MKRIDDDAQVQALAERLGVWSGIARNLAEGKSGVIAMQRWIIGFFPDGLLALETPDPLTAATLAVELSYQIFKGGPEGISWGVADPAPSH